MNGLRLYGRMLAVSMRSQLQYRASFLLTTLGNFISAFADFLGIWAFFDRFGGLQGWTLAETAIFYGIGNVSFALSEMFAREFDVFGSHVRTGSFDRMLLRPRSTVLQMMGAQCQIMRIGRLIQGAGVLAAGVWLLRPAWAAAACLYHRRHGAVLWADHHAGDLLLLDGRIAGDMELRDRRRADGGAVPAGHL